MPRPYAEVLPFVRQQVASRHPAPCWRDWPYSSLVSGRPKLGWERKIVPAVWYAFFSLRGRKHSLWLLHHCNELECWNPHHVYEGTPKQNVKDGVDAHGPSFQARNTALTEAQVQEIRKRYAAGEQGKVLAAEFSVAKSTVSRAVNGKQWVHVSEGNQ